MPRSRAALAIAALAAALFAALASGVFRPRDPVPRRPRSAPRRAAAEIPETSPREEPRRAAIAIALRSAATGEPIRGARIEPTAPGSGDAVSAFTDEDGKIFEAGAGRHRIVARARGLVDLTTEREVSGPGRTLALDPAGDLVLRFLDEDEESVPSVVARLRDPADAGGAAERRSAGDGTFRWLDLAPSGACRRELVSAPVTVDVVPEHEARPFELTETGVRGGGMPPPDGLSGSIAVERCGESGVGLQYAQRRRRPVPLARTPSLRRGS